MADIIREEHKELYALRDAAIEWRDAQAIAARVDGLHLSGPKFDRWDDASRKLHDLLYGLTNEQDAKP